MFTIDMTAPTVEIRHLPPTLTPPTVPSWPSWLPEEAGSAHPAFTEFSSAPVAAGQQALLATGAVIILAALDLAGSYCALRYMQTGHQVWWSAGAVAFIALFAVYCTCLRWAELGTVTLGWIVLLQVGVVTMDWVANGVTLPASKIAAIVAILALMAYVLLAPSHTYTPRHAGRPAPTSGSGVTADAARGWHA